MTSDHRPSVALLTNAPTPYRIPFFNEVSKRCRLLVVFDSLQGGREWDVDPNEFEFEWVVTRKLAMSGRASGRGPTERWIPNVPLDVISILNRFRPDVVISAELGPRTASAVVFCGLRKRPFIIWWEGTPHTDAAVSTAQKAFRRRLLRGATRAWGNGEESAQSLTAYGMSRSLIDLGLTGMDTTRWKDEVDDARAAERNALREHLGLRGVTLLFVGSVTHRKGVQELLSAVEILAAKDLPEWSVLIVGSGPLTLDAEAWARRHPAVPVALLGFVQPSELAKYFAAADVFVMPSLDDVWGMVCLEALIAGLPQVTSTLAGASADLVTSAEIGSIIDPRETPTLVDQLAHWIRLGAQRVPEPLRDRAVAEWATSAMADRAMASIHATL